LPLTVVIEAKQTVNFNFFLLHHGPRARRKCINGTSTRQQYVSCRTPWAHY